MLYPGVVKQANSKSFSALRQNSETVFSVSSRLLAVAASSSHFRRQQITIGLERDALQVRRLMRNEVFCSFLFSNFSLSSVCAKISLRFAFSPSSDVINKSTRRRGGEERHDY